MKKPKVITNSQAERMIRRMEYRDQLLIRLAIQSGLRISDLLRIRNQDISKIMTVYESKSRRDRTFRLDDDLYADLRKHAYYKKKSAYVFHSARDASKPTHRTTIHRRIKNACKGLKINASAHSTRKLYAYNKFAETQSLRAVQDAMHHRNILTTLAYLDIDKSILSQSSDVKEE
jgi:integrase